MCQEFYTLILVSFYEFAVKFVVDFFQTPVRDVRVNLRRGDGSVAQDFLD